MNVERFDFPGKLVMRKNSVDSLGNPIGLEERVRDPITGEELPYDPRYRISRSERGRKERRIREVFGSLSDYFNTVRNENGLDQLVFFGAQEDLNLLRRAGADLRGLDIIDIQKELRPEIGTDISLDKASLIIGFRTGEKSIRSRNFEYDVPSGLRPLIRPHRALGDAARTFLLHKEMLDHPRELIRTAREHLRKIERYRAEEEEIPIF